MEEGYGAPAHYGPKDQPALVEYDITTNIIPQQRALLAQAITAKFPMPTNPSAITEEKAVENLVEIAKVSQENKLLRITPVSVEVKNIPAEVVEKFSKGFLDQRAEEVLSFLHKKGNCPVFKASIDKLVAKFCPQYNLQKNEQLSAVHPVLIKYIEQKCLRKSSKMVESWERMEALTPGNRHFTPPGHY